MSAAASVFLLLGLCSNTNTFAFHVLKVKSVAKNRLQYSSDPQPDDIAPMIATEPPQHDIFSKKGYALKRHDVVEAGSLHKSAESYSLASKLNVKDRSPNDAEHPVQVIGHRGSPFTALENTSRSFLHAAQAGANGVELDVFLLKCGTLVVFHGSGGDENPGLLHSYCEVDGSILDYTAAEARQFLTFNKSFAEFGCGPECITHPSDNTEGLDHYCWVHTLEEVLETIRDHPEISQDFKVKIELKGPDTATPVFELVTQLNLQHMCQYSSFDHSRIAEIRQLDAEAITGALFAGHVPDDFVERCIAVGASEVHFKYDTCTVDRVQAAHEAGLETMAWFRGPIGMKEDHTTRYFDVGNEDVAMYQTVLRSGVKSMCVNKPEVLVRALEETRRRHLPRL